MGGTTTRGVRDKGDGPPIRERRMSMSGMSTILLSSIECDQGTMDTDQMTGTEAGIVEGQDMIAVTGTELPY